MRSSLDRAERAPLGPIPALIGVCLLLAACATGTIPPGSSEGPIKIVTSTTIIADVVSQIAGAKAEVESLLPPGADPHSYEATSADLRALSSADLVLINGLGLEESLQTVLSEAGDRLLSLNDGIDPSLLIESASEESEHSQVDPHTWLDPGMVLLWVDTIEVELSSLRPEESERFQANGDAYRAELRALIDELEAQFAPLPPEARTLVSEHDALAYLARALNLRTGGSILPSVSTVAEPSAGHLARIQDYIRQQNVRAIFIESGSDRTVVRELATDLAIPITPLYIGTLSGADGPAPTYLQMMRYNAEQIIQALTGGE